MKSKLRSIIKGVNSILETISVWLSKEDISVLVSIGVPFTATIPVHF